MQFWLDFWENRAKSLRNYPSLSQIVFFVYLLTFLNYDLIDHINVLPKSYPRHGKCNVDKTAERKFAKIRKNFAQIQKNLVETFSTKFNFTLKIPLDN